MESFIDILPGLRIPTSEVTFEFTRSRGPGGQNVNKVATRVELLFDLAGSRVLTEEQKNTIRVRLRRRIGSDGILRVWSQESRSQWKNREDAREKFALLLARSLQVRKHRIPSVPTRPSRAHRMEAKKRRSSVKSLRRRISPDE